MGKKWSTVAVTGYNSSPPSDDGSQTTANEVKWATITSKVGTPIYSATVATIANLDQLFDAGPETHSTTYTTVVSDHTKTLECTGSFTLSLLTPSTAGKGYSVTVKNSGSGTVTVDVEDASTIDGNSSVSILANRAITFTVNNGASNYYQTSDVSGTILQVVEATPYTTYADQTTAIPTDNTIPQNTEGTEIMTVSITPTSTSNILLIEAFVSGSLSASANGVVALFQDTTANALSACTAGPAIYVVMPLTHSMTAGTTSSTTFKIRTGPNTGHFYVNGTGSARLFGGVSACRLRVTEIKA